MKQLSHVKIPGTYKRILLAAFVFILVETLVQSFHMRQDTQRKETIRVATRVTAEQVILRIESAVNRRLDALQRLATAGPVVLTSKAAFTQSAEHILSNYPDFQAVNWVDENLVIQVVVPEERNRGALGASLQNHGSPSVRTALQKSLDTDKLQRTNIIDLLQGGKGIATYLPVRDSRGNLVGLVNSVLRLENLIDAALPEEDLRRQYNFAICAEDDSHIYECYRDQQAQVTAFDVTLPIQIVRNGWRFEMSPTEGQLEALTHPMDDALVWIAHILALTGALITMLMTRRKQQIRQSEERYHELFFSSQEGIFILDAQNRLIDVNPAALRMFAYDRGEVIGQPVNKLPQDQEQLAKLRQLIVEGRSINREEAVFRKKNGDLMRCLVSAHARYDEEQRYIGVQGIINDITEQHRTLEQLRQAQKMEAIGQLAGGVAHDFNNLLTVISGNSELALLQLGEDNPARVELKEIRATAGRAANLTRQLLAFSRKQVIKPRLLDANGIIQDMDRMLKRVIGELIDFQSDLQHKAWSIKVDPAQLEQVIVNLVVNSRDAMERGGELKICTRNLIMTHEREFENIPAGDYLMIEVSDTGSGIPQDIQEHIFEPFFTTKAEGAGTGLGLATVYGIVKQSGGHILLESAPGLGTAFRIFFPRQADHQGEVRKDELELPSEGGSECLLVVEDERALRRMIVDSLSRQGFRVLEAADGQEAVDRLPELIDKIDMIISDVVMPKVGGVECVKQFGGHLPDLPALFISGYSEEAIQKHGDLQPDARLLMKPFQLAELHRQVRKILDSGRVARKAS